MAYQPVGPKRDFLFQIVERIRIVLYKIWYGPQAMSKLLATTVHPTLILEKFGANIQHPVYLRPSLRVINARNAKGLTLATGVHIGESVSIDLSSPISIGANSVIAQGSLLITHQSKGRVISPFAYDTLPSALTIESNVLVTVNVIILNGVELIVEGTVIGAGSLVTKSITEPGIYVGSPVRKIR